MADAEGLQDGQAGEGEGEGEGGSNSDMELAEGSDSDEVVLVAVTQGGGGVESVSKEAKQRERRTRLRALKRAAAARSGGNAEEAEKLRQASYDAVEAARSGENAEEKERVGERMVIEVKPKERRAQRWREAQRIPSMVVIAGTDYSLSTNDRALMSSKTYRADLASEGGGQVAAVVVAAVVAAAAAAAAAAVAQCGEVGQHGLRTATDEISLEQMVTLFRWEVGLGVPVGTGVRRRVGGVRRAMCALVRESRLTVR